MNKDSMGIQSLEFAFQILEEIKKNNEPISVTALSKGMGIPKSKLYRYLVSFVRLGVLVQDKSTFLYSMGPKLVELGLSALNKLDVISVSEPYLINLTKVLNQSSGLAIWTEKGPLVVKYFKSDRPINIDMQVGFHAPLLKSASGKCFAAFLPDYQIHELMEKELNEYGIKRGEVEEELNNIRNNLLAYRGNPYYSIPGSKAIASPIFDYSGKIVATLLLIGFSGEIGIDACSKEAIMLKKTAGEISRLLSYSKGGDI